MSTSYDDLDKPDYETYSLDQLYDARSHIDEERYPDRVAEIDRQIMVRLQEPAAEPPDEAPLRPENFGLSKRVIGYFLFFSGLWSFAASLARAVQVAGSMKIAVLGLIVFTYGGMILAGIIIWKRRYLGILVGMVAMAVQIPAFTLGRIAYKVSAVPTLELKLWPRFGFGFSTGGTLVLFLHDAAQGVYLGLNVPAILLTWALSYYALRRQAALRRSRRMAAAG